MHGPRVTFQIDDESAAQGIVNAFVFIKVSGIEKVARVLAVERRDDLPGVEVGEGENRDFGEAKLLLYFFGNASCLGVINGPPQHRCNVDLYHRIVSTDEKVRAGTRLPFRNG